MSWNPGAVESARDQRLLRARVRSVEELLLRLQAKIQGFIAANAALRFAEDDLVAAQIEDDIGDTMNALWGGAPPFEAGRMPVGVFDYGSHLIRGILSETADQLNAIVQNSIEEGMSREQIRDRILGIDAADLPLTGARSRLIAQTECMRAYSATNYERYRLPGLGYVMWLDRQAESCSSCRTLHGRIIPLDNYFQDPVRGLVSLFPPLHPGCRCATRAATPEEYARQAASSSFLRPEQVYDIGGGIGARMVDSKPPYVSAKGNVDVSKLDLNAFAADDDAVLRQIMLQQGFYSPAGVYTKAEIDAFIRAGERELRRGVTRPEFARDFIDSSGTNKFTGTGVHGNGLYLEALNGSGVPDDFKVLVKQKFDAYMGSVPEQHRGRRDIAETMMDSAIQAARKEIGGDVAQRYSRHGEESIIRMTLRPEAKVITQKDLRNERNMNPDPALPQTMEDGRYAAAKGYDAILVEFDEGGDYMILLNRSAVRIQDAPIIGGRVEDAALFDEMMEEFGGS